MTLSADLVCSNNLFYKCFTFIFLFVPFRFLFQCPYFTNFFLHLRQKSVSLSFKAHWDSLLFSPKSQSKPQNFLRQERTSYMQNFVEFDESNMLTRNFFKRIFVKTFVILNMWEIIKNVYCIQQNKNPISLVIKRAKMTNAVLGNELESVIIQLYGLDAKEKNEFACPVVLLYEKCWDTCHKVNVRVTLFIKVSYFIWWTRRLQNWNLYWNVWIFCMTIYGISK